jgi:polysaccharide biosynthesis/export protein VpsN
MGRLAHRAMRALSGAMLALLVAMAGCISPAPRAGGGASRSTYAVDSRKPMMMAPAPTVDSRTTNAFKAAPRATLPVAAPAFKLAAAPAAGGKEYTPYRLKPGDPVIINLRGLVGIAGGQQQIEGNVNENGEVNLPLIGVVKAAGRTSSELEEAVQREYLDQQIYKYITVNVLVPSRVYYVRGEVRQPGRFPIFSGVTIVQAIAAAGGFSEFANPSKVEIVRGTDHFRVNVTELESRPEKDREVEVGDVIIVPRSFL